ncbi:polycomb group RING finger protein 6 [Salmo salar]|uniref:Polycomb group RING finger protein 6 n=1 Tax=Salmo salar TaxID=8030 RepID=A0A1S3S0K3_SALSA|nr:polycomb group RING finger protein 6-like [Salmo salar]|eukprot:XP_014057950.1 PREDICTED: polycomb group RING finger protein 6-like isoform X4 [Salmo salar]
MEDSTTELERPGCLSVGQQSEEATPTHGSRQNRVDNDGSKDHNGTSNNVDSDSEDEPELPLNQFYSYIRCTLCCGILIDSTTITECLHTFCKSCIVKHFFYSNRCPNCSIVVHQTQPLYNIKPDRQLQDIVYKMLPHLEEMERARMIDFYKQRGLEVPKPVMASPAVPVLKNQKQRRALLPQSVFAIPPELDVSLQLEFLGAEEGIDGYKPLERRYVRVSGDATVRHVALFIRRKMALSPNCQVDVVCGDHLLDCYQSLREVQSSMGDNALQDGLLILHFGLVLAAHM